MLTDVRVGTAITRRARRSVRPGAGLPRSVLLRRTLVAADALALLAASTAALLVADPDGRFREQLPWLAAYLPVLLLLFQLYSLYDGDAKRISHSTLDDVPAVFHAVLLGTLGLFGLFKLAGVEGLVLAQASAFLVLNLLVVVVARSASRRLVHRLAAPERVVVVGSGPAAQGLIHKLRGHPRYGVLPVGRVADDGYLGEAGARDLPHLGPLRELAGICSRHGIERALVATPGLESGVVTDLIREANRINVKVSLLPTVVDVLGPSTELDDLGGMVLLGLNPVRWTRSSWLLKRGLDLVVGSAMLVAVLPLLPIIALAIRVDSPGRALFAQHRAGRGGRPIRVYKFRTMVADAEERLEALRSESAHAAWLLLADDPRVTRVGRFLRVTSLDELPQLWNVLRGEMSLVGPRPMPLETDRHINGWSRRRLDLTPGLTGPWQVLGRTAIPFEEMLKLDYIYVTNWSVWGDIRLLIRTVFVVLGRRGAN